MHHLVHSSVGGQECDNLWWDAFTTEFFEDDAMLTITFCLEDGPKRYSKPSTALEFRRRDHRHYLYIQGA